MGNAKKDNEIKNRTTKKTNNKIEKRKIEPKQTDRTNPIKKHADPHRFIVAKCSVLTLL